MILPSLILTGTATDLRIWNLLNVFQKKLLKQYGDRLTFDFLLENGARKEAAVSVGDHLEHSLMSAL